MVVETMILEYLNVESVGKKVKDLNVTLMYVIKTYILKKL
jgi:hypothetical protein